MKAKRARVIWVGKFKDGNLSRIWHDSKEEVIDIGYKKYSCFIESKNGRKK